MKRMSLALFALILAMPLLAADEPTPVIEEELFTPAEAELLTVDEGKSPEDSETSMSQEVLAFYEPDLCEECTCYQLTTPPVTKVGSTCSNARQNAAAAARALAVCAPGTNGSCGPVNHSIGTCSPNPAGAGFQATATATYYCEICIWRPC